jgi:hypothetical protein
MFIKGEPVGGGEIPLSAVLGLSAAAVAETLAIEILPETAAVAGALGEGSEVVGIPYTTAAVGALVGGRSRRFTPDVVLAVPPCCQFLAMVVQFIERRESHGTGMAHPVRSAGKRTLIQWCLTLFL